MALIDMKSNLAIGVGSKQTPQSFTDGHSATTITGTKTFPTPPRTKIESKVFSAVNRQGEELKFQFNDKFSTKTIKEMQVPGLQKYYDRAFKNSDPLGARNNDRLGFDEPFILKGIGDRWGPGGLGKLDLGLVRAGAVTQAARTVADVIRIGKFLLTPRGIGFAIKQDILQKMNAGGEFGFGTLGAMLGQKLGKPVTLNAKQQRFSTGRDIFRDTPGGRGLGQGYPTVDEMKGSDIRTWRPTSLIDSLPIGAHYVRHKVPAGSPSIQLVKNIGNFLVDSGDGVLKFIDGIDVAFPHVSLNPDFKAGDILTGAGKAIKGAANGIVDVFPNIYDTAKGGVQAIGEGIANIVGGIQPPKITFGNMDSFTSLFPGLIQLPKIKAPDFSGLTSMLGGLANVAAGLLKGVASGIGSALGGLSLPKLPNMRLPNVSLPKLNLNLGNPFEGMLNAAKGINLNFPKFSGSGGLGLGSFEMPDLSGIFPTIRLGVQISKGSLHFDMAAFDEGKAKFQSGLQNLLTQPDALKTVPAQNFGKENVDIPGTMGIKKHRDTRLRYGIHVEDVGSSQTDFSHNFFDTPNLYYTIAQPSVAQDNKGGLTNIYSEENAYTSIFLGKLGVNVMHGLGIYPGEFSEDDMPMAFSAGFLSGARYGIEDKNFPLNTEKKAPTNANITPTFPDNAVTRAGSTAARLQKYKMLDYGSLEDSNKYESRQDKAAISRGLGDGGAAGRTAVIEDGKVIKVDGAGGLKNTLNDHLNLHPYGGSSVDINANDTEIDFVPLKFRDMVNGKWIIFRCILESVSDTSSPEYAEERYIGRPDKVYVYQGATRNVSLTFKVMPKSVQELVTLWDKLNYLKGLLYPTIQNNRMVSPFFSFTLGDMFDKQPMIFQSLNFSIDAASTWEIKPGIRLPKLINVSADMRIVDKTTPQTTGKHFDLDWLSDNLKHGTFANDPWLPDSLTPNRMTSLFDSLGIAGVDKDVFTKLAAGTAAIKVKEALIDSLKSDVDVPNIDLPKLPSVGL